MFESEPRILRQSRKESRRYHDLPLCQFHDRTSESIAVAKKDEESFVNYVLVDTYSREITVICQQCIIFILRTNIFKYIMIVLPLERNDINLHTNIFQICSSFSLKPTYRIRIVTDASRFLTLSASVENLRFPSFFSCYQLLPLTRAIIVFELLFLRRIHLRWHNPY